MILSYSIFTPIIYHNVDKKSSHWVTGGGKEFDL